MKGVCHMPTVDDLREIARAAHEIRRGERAEIPDRPAILDLAFALSELRLLGRVDVYDEEVRRHELLLRGFTPPDEQERIE